MNNEKETSRKEFDDNMEKVTFQVHGRPAFGLTYGLKMPPMEDVTVLLSPLNARRFRNNPLQETFYGYWHHTEEQKNFNDWLVELWEEANQRFSLPGKAVGR